MQCNRNIVRVKQLLQCGANSRDGEQSMNCVFYPDSGLLVDDRERQADYDIRPYFWTYSVLTSDVCRR